MSGIKQIVASVLLIGVAVAIVGVRLRSGASEAVVEAGGHDMAAMSGGGGTMQPVVLDPEAARRIGVTMATVERRELTTLIRTVGTVAYDETRLASVSPKLEGWVERLHVDFTGAPVAAGQPLMDVYSPALVSAQEELILATRLVREASPGRARTNAEQLLASSRRRLAYWDIPADVIRGIEESSEPSKTLTLRAPAGGIVVEKNVVEGDRIMPGMTLYRIADLSEIWIEAEVFEKDLGLVREGQQAVATFEAYPGRQFAGRVTFVHPTVSIQSRTARVRIELPNPNLALRPGMYASVELESLPTPPTLVVPRSAVIDTGQRTLVFVERADGALVPREVQAGRTSGRFMEILTGLSAGERIVSSAAFLVDAESNLGTMAREPASPADSSMEGMDHSENEMDSMPSAPDTVGDAAPSGHDGHEG
jgi:Cu(I)/Ag(I) efflux system membrane fusion protein